MSSVARTSRRLSGRPDKAAVRLGRLAYRRGSLRWNVCLPGDNSEIVLLTVANHTASDEQFGWCFSGRQPTSTMATSLPRRARSVVASLTKISHEWVLDVYLDNQSVAQLDVNVAACLDPADPDAPPASTDPPPTASTSPADPGSAAPPSGSGELGVAQVFHRPQTARYSAVGDNADRLGEPLQPDEVDGLLERRRIRVVVLGVITTMASAAPMRSRNGVIAAARPLRNAGGSPHRRGRSRRFRYRCVDRVDRRTTRTRSGRNGPHGCLRR